MKRTPKTQTSEPSLRDKLTARFVETLEADFQQHGIGVIEKLREKHPERYADIVARLVAPIEQPARQTSSAAVKAKLISQSRC